VDAEPLRQLGHRLLLAQRRQRYLRLELRIVFLPSRTPRVDRMLACEETLFLPDFA
jgi:hypothetical protein